MSLVGLLIGVIQIIIVAAVLLLIGYLVLWACTALFGVGIPIMIQRLYMIIVALICLVMLIDLLVTGLVPFRGWHLALT